MLEGHPLCLTLLLENTRGTGQGICPEWANSDATVHLSWHVAREPAISVMLPPSNNAWEKLVAHRETSCSHLFRKKVFGSHHPWVLVSLFGPVGFL